MPGQTMNKTETLEPLLTALCGAPPPSQLAGHLAALAQEVRVSRGGSAPLDHRRDLFVYIAQGSTKLVASASAGREQIVAFHFAGDIVSVPAHSLHSYSLNALEPTHLLIFPASEMHAAIAGNPAVLAGLLQRVLTALHRCRDKAVGLGRKNAGERVASFLVGMAERIGHAERGEITLDLPMSRRDIADSLGLTIETVSRQFSEMRSAGWLRTQGRAHVRLLQPATLAAHAGHVELRSP